MPFYKDVHIEKKLQFSEFMTRELAPVAQKFDDEQCIPKSFFQKLAANGFLGANVPALYGGQEMDYVTLSLLHEEAGKVLCSLENILTVYGMVCKPLARFGTKKQKEWLSKIVAGETVVAIALTEPEIGSDLKNIQTQAILSQNYYILNGQKKYITLGQIADLFLVLAKNQTEDIALLVEKNTPGLSVTPIYDTLGFRSNMLAEITFENCQIPKESIVGSVGGGFVQVIACALDEGRFTTACGCVGLGQACLNLARKYTNNRVQAETLLKNHQLIQKMLTEMIVQVKASREICFNTACLRDAVDMSYLAETLVAKYFSAKMAMSVAENALDVFGASGFTKEQSIGRFYRDAKIMSVIEGTSQLFEINIPKICLD